MRVRVELSDHPQSLLIMALNTPQINQCAYEGHNSV